MDATEAGRLDLTALAEVPTERLWAELESGADFQAEHLKYLAAIYDELDRRGEDMSAFRGGYYAYLKRIASGTLMPEVMQRFLGTAVCGRVASLPIAQQKDLLNNGASVPLAVFQDGQFTHRNVPLAELVPSQVEQVFGRAAGACYIRSVAEQTRLLQSPQAAPTTYRRTKKKDRIKVDRAAGVVTFTVRTVTLEELCDALRKAGITKL